MPVLCVNVTSDTAFEFSHNTQVGNVDIFVLLIFENKIREISHFNYNSKHFDQCKIALKQIGLKLVFNLFSLELDQKCQHCQLCVLGENTDANFDAAAHDAMCERTLNHNLSPYFILQKDKYSICNEKV